MPALLSGLDDSFDTFHSCKGSIQRSDAAEAGKQQRLENNLTFGGLQRCRLSLASTSADCEAACV